MRTPLFLPKSLQPISAGTEWPFVSCPHCSFEWHSWPSSRNSSMSFEDAPLQSRTSSVGWSLSAARTARGAAVSCAQSHQNAAFPSCWSWGLFAAEFSWQGWTLLVMWVEHRAVREEQSLGSRGEHGQRAPAESAAVTEEREVKKGRGKKKALTVPQGQGLLSFQMPTAFQTETKAIKYEI